MIRLHLGSGLNVLKVYVNVDLTDKYGAEVIHDLEKFPYPFEDNTFDEIFADNTIEHLKDVYYSYVDKRRKLHLNKTVHYFLMKYCQGDINSDDPEVETVVLVDIDEAIEKVTFLNEKQTLQRALCSIRQE